MIQVVVVGVVVARCVCMGARLVVMMVLIGLLVMMMLLLVVLVMEAQVEFCALLGGRSRRGARLVMLGLT